MNREGLYEADYDDDDDEEDNIGEDLEDLRRACMFSGENSDGINPATQSVGADGSGGGGGGGMPSDSESEDDLEMLLSVKSQLASSKDVDLCGGPPAGLSVPSDSESEEDDYEILRSIKSQLALSMNMCVPPVGLSDDDEDDDAFETLRVIRRRFSAYENFGNGIFMNDSPRKKKQVYASDNEPSSKILSRSNTCESFPDHGKSVVIDPDSEEVQAGHSTGYHENTATEPLDQLETCQPSLPPAVNPSFPESAQALFHAIRKNRSYQRFLRGKLMEIEATIEKNEKLKKNVKIVNDFQADRKRITNQALSQRKDPRLELISTRKHRPSDSSEGNEKKRSILSLGPPENSCVANYNRAREKYPVSVNRRNWSAKENKNLAKGLKQQIQETLLNEAIERSNGLEGYTNDIDDINESIRNLEITPEMIRQFLPKVNWDQLASRYVKGRSAAECEARWMSSEDPLINHGPWTLEEDNNLLLIVKGNSFTNWLDIAISLGTNRTPFQCLSRYQRSFNADQLRSEWTEEEDEQLRAAVDLFGEKNWQSVANVIEGRSGTQCSTRWKKTLPLARESGKWSSEQSKRLKVAVTLFGPRNWNKIAQFVPGRTPPQCRERWVNVLDPRVNKSRWWTKEEDAKLREAIAEYGYSSWSKVASHLSRRTDNQCWRRWKTLYPHQVPLLKEAKRSQKEAVICNFVDREQERPALVAGNILALPGISLEEEPVIVSQKKKGKARRKKPDAACESEVSRAATERQPKRRRKRSERASGDVCEKEDSEGEVTLSEWYNKEKQRQRRRRLGSVAETSNNSSTVTTKSSQVRVGLNKLTPRRRVPMKQQDAPV